jgi:hypothetical protein
MHSEDREEEIILLWNLYFRVNIQRGLFSKSYVK